MPVLDRMRPVPVYVRQTTGTWEGGVQARSFLRSAFQLLITPFWNKPLVLLQNLLTAYGGYHNEKSTKRPYPLNLQAP
jgi:hypothetical protein